MVWLVVFDLFNLMLRGLVAELFGSSESVRRRELDLDVFPLLFWLDSLVSFFLWFAGIA